MPAPSPHRALNQPKAAVLLLCLAAAVWIGVLIRRHHVSMAQAHIEAGREYARLRRNAQAEQEWRIAARLEPKNVEAWALLGQLALTTHSWRSAVAAYTQLQQIAPNTPHLHSCLASASLHAGDDAAALQHAREELKRDPDDVAALLVASGLLVRMGIKEEALTDLRRLVQIQPDELHYQEMLADALIRAGKSREALPVLDRLLGREPQNAYVVERRGKARLEADPTPQGLAAAEADLQQALKWNPALSPARWHLGRVYLRRRQPLKALPLFEATVRGMPNEAGVWYDLARTYAMIGRPQQSAAARARFTALKATADREEALETRCNAAPNDFKSHLQAGLLLLEIGDAHRAAYFIRRAGALRPNAPEAKRALQRLLTP